MNIHVKEGTYEIVYEPSDFVLKYGSKTVADLLTDYKKTK